MSLSKDIENSQDISQNIYKQNENISLNISNNEERYMRMSYFYSGMEQSQAECKDYDLNDSSSLSKTGMDYRTWLQQRKRQSEANDSEDF